MLVNSKKLLEDAKKRKYAIPAANFIDVNSARTYCKTAEKLGLPLILAFAQSHRHILSLEEAAVIGSYWAKKVETPVVLHLDHGEDKDYIFKAIDLGFSSVMIDASMESFEDNVRLSKEIVDHAHKYDISVEAELGHVGANDNSESYDLTDSIYTEAKDVINFVDKTNVDSLAISIGTAHGVYKGTPKINFERLKEIDQMTDIPLVLHGGSSSGDENLHRCATNGISKINIYTDFIVGAYKAIKEEKPAGYIEMKEVADRAMEKVLTHYFKVFATKQVDL